MSSAIILRAAATRRLLKVEGGSGRAFALALGSGGGDVLDSTVGGGGGGTATVFSMGLGGFFALPFSGWTYGTTRTGGVMNVGRTTK